jgi:glycerol-3-phosphate dehydrogenase subunit C
LSSVNPKRASVPWNEAEFYDEAACIKEIYRVFEICHGCRRCFNLCALFPKLFDRIDACDGWVEKLTLEDIDFIISSCTLCDMCFAVKCPYIPPHPWNVDFPRLMLRYRAIQSRKKKSLQKWAQSQVAQTDRVGKIAVQCPSIVNTLTKISRPLMEKSLGIDRQAYLPEFRKNQLVNDIAPYDPDPHGPLYGQKIAVYATCFMNYYVSKMAQSTLRILAHHGLSVELIYPGCCQMPQLEQGNLTAVIQNARRISSLLRKKMEEQEGVSLISLVPSCTLMLKSEWPDLLPGHSDVQFVAEHTFDICDFMIRLHQQGNLRKEFSTLPSGISLHTACHMRALNRGNKSKELLSLLPNTPVLLIERCSGHGGFLGMQKEHFDEAMVVGQSVFRAIQKAEYTFVSSECPLALLHLKQGIEQSSSEQQESPLAPFVFAHPMELLALSYGF